MAKKTTWDFNLILDEKNIDKLRADVRSNADRFISKWKNRTDYLTDPAILSEALKEYENFISNYGTYDSELYYFNQKTTLDLNNPDLKAKYNEVYRLAIALYNETQFFTINISKIEKDSWHKFLESEYLKEYRHFLELLFLEGEHVLTDDQEKIVNIMIKTSYGNWVDMLSGLLATEEAAILIDNKKVTKNFSELIELNSNKNKKIRDQAFEAVCSIFKKHLQVSENEFNSVLETYKNENDLRKFKTPYQKRHLADDIDTKIVDLMVGIVSKKYSIVHRYYELKSKVLGLSELDYNDRNVEVGEISKEYKFEEAYEIVLETFANLDPYFGKLFSEFFDKGQVDVFPKKGKLGGAHCGTNRKTDPTFIMLNHGSSLNNVLTMAHEFGHAINFELSKKQNELNFDFPLCTAESASTFFEDFVLQELKKSLTEEQKFDLMMMKLNDDVNTIFRQVAFYEFELQIHEEFNRTSYISKEKLSKVFTSKMNEYMGPFVKQNSGSENFWVYISHFRNPFYVYSYAFGLLVSKALQNLVKEDHSNIKKVKDFFSVGKSISPQNALSDLGFEISKAGFWERGIAEIESELSEAENLFNSTK